MQDSIYHHKRREFKQLIQRFDDKSITITDAIGGFREFKCLSKEFKQVTIQQLNDNSNLIEELFHALRNGMKAEAKFQLPYSKEERKQELIENISEISDIIRQEAQASIVTGHYQDNEREFNYCLEAVIAPIENANIDDAGSIEIIGNINSSCSIDGGDGYFDWHYTWENRKGRTISAWNLRGILAECGFTDDWNTKMSKKRVPCILYINLFTPCPDWLGGAGKTHIDIKPYAEDIAKAVSSLAYKMPSYHGQLDNTPIHDHSRKEKSAISYLEDFLNERFDKIESDPSLKHRDPLTQSGVWYRIRPIMIRDDFTPPKDWGKTREYITGSIDKVCQELFDNIEREDLGIVAKARGMMLYGGQTYPVDMDSFEALGKKGVFILVIEKEGIAAIFKDVARDSGVALVHTAGRFTKYVKYLIEHAQVPVATLTDYDAYGIEISAATISRTPRVGIDMDIIGWLRQNGYPDLKQEDVEEEYVSGIRTGNEYLKKHRIELDSISEKVGPELFWKYVKHKIEELQKEEGFDYSNIITQPEPEELYPEEISNLISKLREYVENIIEDDWETIETEELTKVKELISINEREAENVDVLSKTVDEDEIMQQEIIPIVRKLSEQLSGVLERDDPEALE